MRTRLAVLLALPGVTLAVAGLFHPGHLTASTAATWWGLHVPGLVVFPLVGVALMALVAGRRDPVAIVVLVAAFLYATFYTALDVVSGIGAGYVTDRLGPGVPRPDEVRYLFAIGGRLGSVGEWALLVASVVLVLDAARRTGMRALPAVLLPVGALLVTEFHIFPPWGVAGMALVGLGTGYLALVRPGQNSRSVGSSMPRSAS